MILIMDLTIDKYVKVLKMAHVCTTGKLSEKACYATDIGLATSIFRRKVDTTRN